MLAKMLSTLDVLSEGRAVLGVGAGWSKVEFDGYSTWDGPGVRVSKTQEGLDLIIRLWTEDQVTFKGRFYEAEAAVLEPKPVQKPYPKLLFGGTGKRMLRMAGRYGDICYIPMWGGNIEDNWKIVLDAAEKAGRRDKLAIMMGDMGAMRSKDSDGHIASIEAAVENGAEYYMVAFQRGEDYIDSMKKFATEIIPSFS
jgi:alkanesulfonate monooxygenase SsuD/methylene tetrahydromethanopterin reductase-like flavin-dependent oxidoreductase (luciferase family)